MSNPYSNPFSERAAPPNPYVAPSYSPYGAVPGAYYRPHRGALVLTLGIVGLVLSTVGVAVMAALCIPVPFFALAASIPAWILGQKDMKAIACGEMDPTGKPLTMVGMIMGIASTALAGVFSVIIIMGVLFIIGMIIAFSAANRR